MFEKIKQIFKKYNICEYERLNKGFSKDQKFILKDNTDTKYLFRVSDISLYEKKKKQFELLKNIESLDIYCSKPIEFDLLDDNNCYMLLSWLDGIDGNDAIKLLSDEEAYFLGIEAGNVLRKLHNIKIDNQPLTWYENYLIKKERKINSLLNCEYKIPMQEQLLEYYKNNTHLMKDRPLTFCHGDYHLGNMIVKNGKIGIIDFDKNSIADPYDELKPFCWNVRESEYFETGLINGYFDNNIPSNFFKILKFYTIESMISHLPWAIQFGKEEVEVMISVNNDQIKWWKNFELDIPTWYKGICF